MTIKFKNFKGSLYTDFSLKDHNSFKVKAMTSLAIFPKNNDDLKILSENFSSSLFNYFILGEGSNVLLNDKLLIGPIISLKEMPKYSTITPTELIISAGTTVRELLKIARVNGFLGFEKLCGIPGNIGGSVFMNAGTHLGDISELLTSFTIFNLKTGQFQKILKKDFRFSYRKNHLIKPNDLIVEASFLVNIGDPKLVQDQIYQSLKRRKESQPLDKPTCGSVFKNPEHHQAWKLIEDVNLKGHKIGGAEFSTKHSNWIINTGNATSQDILSLIELATGRVQDKFNITLEPEVKKIGF